MIIEVYSDGSCLRNPGLGGYGGIILYGNALLILSGFFLETTNNQMELLGAIKSLDKITSIIKRNSLIDSVQIYTDSQYVKNGIQEWIFNWHRNNWRTANGKPVKNQELWKELHNLNSIINPLWSWVKGHSDNLYNSIVDTVANSTAANRKPFDEKDVQNLKNKFPQISNKTVYVLV